MSAFRSRIHVITIAWLLCQVASLAAFMPEDCCEKHAAMVTVKHAGEEPPCHESEEAPAPEPEPDCPMHHGEGAACPMHRSPSGECCGMSSVCDGPNQPLAHLFSFIGILDAPAVTMGAPPSTPACVDRLSPLLHRLVSPDAPPPKA